MENKKRLVDMNANNVTKRTNNLANTRVNRSLVKSDITYSDIVKKSAIINRKITRDNEIYTQIGVKKKLRIITHIYPIISNL